jgi:hypothetical protein
LVDLNSIVVAATAALQRRSSITRQDRRMHHHLARAAAAPGRAPAPPARVTVDRSDEVVGARSGSGMLSGRLRYRVIPRTRVVQLHRRGEVRSTGSAVTIEINTK